MRRSPRRTFAESSGSSPRVGIRRASPLSRASSCPASTRRPTAGSPRSVARISREGSRSRTRSSRTSTTSRSSRAALGCARRSGATPAALPVGVDLDEEPGIPRRPLRRGADRRRRPSTRCRSRRSPRSRITASAPRRSPRASTRHARLLDDLAEAGVDYDDVVRRSKPRVSRSSSDSFTSLLAGIDAKRAALA